MDHDVMLSTVTIQEIQTISPGELANQYAACNALLEYQETLTGNTTRRQKTDLALFARYLRDASIFTSGKDLFEDITSWRGVTYGLVDGFIRYMKQKGYAIGSINVRLATIKSYCSVAVKAGVLLPDDLILIRGVQGYSHKVGRNIDETREIVRVGSKKSEPVSLSFDQATQLKMQPDTPQGRRDALLMCLLLDHGLRCGEIAALSVSSLDMSQGTLTFYRKKVDKTQTHKLTGDTLLAAIKYFEVCNPVGTLLMGSRKDGAMVGGMGTRTITQRMNTLCQRIGIVGVSAHDGRHAWATFAVRGGTDLKSLQDAGGWSSLAMPARYAESQKIANKGVVLGK